MAVAFKRSQKLVFAGDSITDAGRFEEAWKPLGAGFVRDVWQLLSACCPSLGLTVVNKGVSGNRSCDLLARWDTDVIREAPDWLFIKIGVNDVWRTFDGLGDHVPIDAFERNYREMLDRTVAGTGAEIVPIEPFLVEPNAADPFRALLDQYRGVVRRLAQERGLRLVKLQDAFDKALKAKSAAFWSEDRVHPTEAGHMLIALEILAVCGMGFGERP